jgi:GT2 family glycosyltransferase
MASPRGNAGPLVGRWRIAAPSRNRVSPPDHVAAHVITRFSTTSAVEAVPAASCPSTTPGCCVAVCTSGRPASVLRFLESLRTQEPAPQQVVVVDASPDDATEQALRAYPLLGDLAQRLDYLRVDRPLSGLTPQRNIALRTATTDLIAFFDDDIVLLPGCLAEMARVHRATPRIVGVAAVIVNERSQPPALWRVRSLLRIIPTLRPGRYTPSGIQTPWRFLPPTDAVVEGEWLPGGATMWKTVVAREVWFNEGLDGYASGEDLEFSLLMRRKGKTVVAGSAHLLHLQDSSGRPNAFQMGYMGLRNLFYIHQACRPHARSLDTAYFLYGFSLDTLVRLLALLRPGERRMRWEFLRGRLRFFGEFLGFPGRNGAEVGREPHGVPQRPECSP